MSNLFHINLKGEIKRCRSFVRKCRFEHFPSENEAILFFEEKYKDTLRNSIKKSKSRVLTKITENDKKFFEENDQGKFKSNNSSFSDGRKDKWDKLMALLPSGHENYIDVYKNEEHSRIINNYLNNSDDRSDEKAFLYNKKDYETVIRFFDLLIPRLNKKFKKKENPI